MRHSSIDMIMNTYIDPRLLDVFGALDALPALPLENDFSTKQKKATGTHDGRQLAPMLAPDLVQASISQANADKMAGKARRDGSGRAASVSSSPDKRKEPLSLSDNGSQKSGRQDLNLRPLRPERSALAKLSYAP